MSNAVGIILVIGAVAGAAYLFMNACTIDFMKFACGNKGSANMQAISKRIQDQFDFSPGTPARKAADSELNSIKNRPTYKPGQILPSQKSPTAKYSNLVNTGRIAI